MAQSDTVVLKADSAINRGSGAMGLGRTVTTCQLTLEARHFLICGFAGTIKSIVTFDF